ncbi:MAG: hypothetical protein OEM97_02745 [Acidimicrobiia bacterium]|nr:hypothetical protein [Acidimicrobiia bacterium]
MKVFISYRDDHHATAVSLAAVLSARGLAVRYLNGTSPTGYDEQREFAEQLDDHDTIVFIRRYSQLASAHCVERGHPAPLRR